MKAVSLFIPSLNTAGHNKKNMIFYIFFWIKWLIKFGVKKSKNLHFKTDEVFWINIKSGPWLNPIKLSIEFIPTKMKVSSLSTFSSFGPTPTSLSPGHTTPLVNLKFIGPSLLNIFFLWVKRGPRPNSQQWFERLEFGSTPNNNKNTSLEVFSS